MIRRQSRREIDEQDRLERTLLGRMFGWRGLIGSLLPTAIFIAVELVRAASR